MRKLGELLFWGLFGFLLSAFMYYALTDYKSWPQYEIEFRRTN